MIRPLTYTVLSLLIFAPAAHAADTGGKVPSATAGSSTTPWVSLPDKVLRKARQKDPKAYTIDPKARAEEKTKPYPPRKKGQPPYPPRDEGGIGIVGEGGIGEVGAEDDIESSGGIGKVGPNNPQ